MKNILIPILLLASAGAYADSAAESQLREAAAQSSLTRAEVKADYDAAKNAGTLFDLSEGTAIKPERTSGERSRAEVRSEAIKEARAYKNHAQPF